MTNITTNFSAQQSLTTNRLIIAKTEYQRFATKSKTIKVAGNTNWCIGKNQINCYFFYTKKEQPEIKERQQFSIKFANKSTNIITINTR